MGNKYKHDVKVLIKQGIYIGIIIELDKYGVGQWLYKKTIYKNRTFVMFIHIPIIYLQNNMMTYGYKDEVWPLSIPFWCLFKN